MHVDPDRLLFMFDERILIFLKRNSFLPTVSQNTKNEANPLKKTEIWCYMTEVPAFRPFFQRDDLLWKSESHMYICCARRNDIFSLSTLSAINSNHPTLKCTYV